LRKNIWKAALAIDTRARATTTRLGKTLGRTGGSAPGAALAATSTTPLTMLIAPINASDSAIPRCRTRKSSTARMLRTAPRL
jgi:hypothetical protein